MKALAYDMQGHLGSALFTHGYATPFTDSIKAAAQLMLLSNRIVVAFSWPSLGKMWAYAHDQRRAEESVKPMVQILKSFSKVVSLKKSAHALSCLIHTLP